MKSCIMILNNVAHIIFSFIHFVTSITIILIYIYLIMRSRYQKMAVLLPSPKLVMYVYIVVCYIFYDRNYDYNTSDIFSSFGVDFHFPLSVLMFFVKAITILGYTVYVCVCFFLLFVYMILSIKNQKIHNFIIYLDYYYRKYKIKIQSSSLYIIIVTIKVHMKALIKLLLIYIIGYTRLFFFKIRPLFIYVVALIKKMILFFVRLIKEIINKLFK
jgi:hypothetical protein